MPNIYQRMYLLYRPRIIEDLYAGELSVRAASERGVLRGSLMARPVAGAIDSPRPVLLTGKSELVGMAWMTIGMDCDLHYEVSV